MPPRSSFSGAMLRLTLTIAVLTGGSTAALADPGAQARPPMRSANFLAATSTQAAAIPATGAAPVVAVAPISLPTPVPQSGGALSALAIETATYPGGDLPAGQSALAAKVQVLLDRAGISPGVVDGWHGGMSESAIRAFQRRAGLPTTGRMNQQVWDLLQVYADSPLTDRYTITNSDAQGLVSQIPSDYAEKAAMASQGYTSVLERLGERFHMDEKFLAKLNPGVRFEPGSTISVTRPAKRIRKTVTRIIIDKATRRVAAYDIKGNLVADYPATVGSTDTPSPHGTHLVKAVALDPVYTYNPKRNFKQGNNDRVLMIPPGPNGPVGDVWIDLSQPTYGIHGTATPSRLFMNQSHGCVRLTNWDARELAHMVKANVTTVEFLDPGVSIADVTGPRSTARAAAPISIRASRPPMRSTAVTDRAALLLPASSPSAVAAPPASRADAITSAVQEAASTVASTVVNPTRPVEAPANRGTGESLGDALARAEAIADEMLSQRAQDNMRGASNTEVGSQTLPPAAAQSSPQL